MAKEGILVKIAINSVVEAGKMLVSGLLVEIKDNNTEQEWNELIKTMGNAFSLLERAAAKTKTKTDDKIVSVFKEPIDAAAEADGIIL
jgi:hypothetical protein